MAEFSTYVSNIRNAGYGSSIRDDIVGAFDVLAEEVGGDEERIDILLAENVTYPFSAGQTLPLNYSFNYSGELETNALKLYLPQLSSSEEDMIYVLEAQDSEKGTVIEKGGKYGNKYFTLSQTGSGYSISGQLQNRSINGVQITATVRLTNDSGLSGYLETIQNANFGEEVIEAICGAFTVLDEAAENVNIAEDISAIRSSSDGAYLRRKIAYTFEKFWKAIHGEDIGPEPSGPVLIEGNFSENGRFLAKNYGADGWNVANVSVTGKADQDLTALIDKTIMSIENDAKIIGPYAFYYCTSLTTVSFPACTTIGPSAFYYCVSLTTVSFPACTTIGTSAFYYCPSLTTVSFPACTTIGPYAFYYCASLTTVSFPACTTIGSRAFQQCASLTTVSFPACTTIGSYAFIGCASLLSLYLLGSSRCTLLNTNAFVSTPINGYTTETSGRLGSIYVPASLYSEYISIGSWAYFSERFVSVET